MEHTENKCCPKCSLTTHNKYAVGCKFTKCPCHKVQHTEENWEEAFDEEFSGLRDHLEDGGNMTQSALEVMSIKDFISSLLLSQRKELALKVEGMKKLPTEDQEDGGDWDEGYDTAISDILALLN